MRAVSNQDRTPCARHNHVAGRREGVDSPRLLLLAGRRHFDDRNVGAGSQLRRSRRARLQRDTDHLLSSGRRRDAPGDHALHQPGAGRQIRCRRLANNKAFHIRAKPGNPGAGNVRDAKIRRCDHLPRFAGLCLCLVPEDDGTSWWWMGQLDKSDGSIVCWSPYSDDLGDAIPAL